MTRAAIIVADLIADHGYRFCRYALAATAALLAAALIGDML